MATRKPNKKKRKPPKKGTRERTKKTEPVSRHDMERYNRAIIKILDEKGVKDIDEANAFLKSFLEGKTLDEIVEMVDENPEDQAMDLAYQAMNSYSEEEGLSLCNKALEIDPHCIDALVFKAKCDARSTWDFAARLRTIVRDAEQRFGEEFMEETRGHFWGMVETRPYMRARQILVQALESSSQLSEAIVECETMLALNPGDNQGMRDVLRGYYLQTDNIEGVQRLNNDYPEEMCATYMWSAVLERWLSDDLEQAEKLVRAGHRQNPHVVQYLTGKRHPPDILPDYFSFGDESEAVTCAFLLGIAWEHHPKAITWLKTLALK